MRVTVDQIIYQSDAPGLTQGRHRFHYLISIHNDGELPVTIKGRKWVVTSEDGEVMAVEGDGVVGQFPTIQPGKKFSYESFHLIHSGRAVAEGSYLGVDSIGRKVAVRIPKFDLQVPVA